MKGKVIIIGCGLSAIHMAELAIRNHQVEIIHTPEGLNKVMPLIDSFSTGPILLKNMIIPELKMIETRDSKGKLFDPIKSKYHK